VLRLAAITCEALLCLQAAPVSGFRMFLAHRLAGDMGCSGVPCGTFVVAVCPSTRDTCPLASVHRVLPLHHVLPELPAFFCNPSGV
jgi:hypothetical protein